jgi:type II pantothenate kinase
MKLCIDFGYSSTKWVLVEGNKILKKEIVENYSSPILLVNKITRIEKGISETVITGGKASTFKIKNVRFVNELEAMCKGAISLAKESKGLVVNSGTGTSITYFDGKKVIHEGGTGLGGGTVLGLSKLLLKEQKFEKIENLAKNGSLTNIDLQVGDIVGEGIGILPSNITASNFGKLESIQDEDLALGIINIVAENIAINAIQVAKRYKLNEIYFSGRIANSKIILKNMNKIGKLFGVTFRVVYLPEYATAIGCSLL